MQLSEFDYHLPQELIAQTAAEPRDSARLLHFDRVTGEVDHRIFRELPDLLQPGDVLVVNNTKVIPARLETTEGREVFLVKRSPPRDRPCSPWDDTGVAWECLVRGGKFFQPGDTFSIANDLTGEVLEILPSGERVIRFDSPDFDAAVEAHGATPLPPYIEQTEKKVDRYQTTYAKEDKKGSVAAPTAGLHFTPELFEKLRVRDISIEEVTLHVGLGTFAGVKVDDVTKHDMHSEWYELDPVVAERLNRAKSEGRRVIAVGTTACRVLESCADDSGQLMPGTGETDIFIYPGYSFKVLNGLITNFHLPKSTLIMLVSAFIGHDETMQMYKTAVEERYHFFSFGDATLLL